MTAGGKHPFHLAEKLLEEGGWNWVEEGQVGTVANTPNPVPSLEPWSSIQVSLVLSRLIRAAGVLHVVRELMFPCLEEASSGCSCPAGYSNNHFKATVPCSTRAP